MISLNDNLFFIFAGAKYMILYCILCNNVGLLNVFLRAEPKVFIVIFLLERRAIIKIIFKVT